MKNWNQTYSDKRTPVPVDVEAAKAEFFANGGEVTKIPSNNPEGGYYPIGFSRPRKGEFKAYMRG